MSPGLAIFTTATLSTQNFGNPLITGIMLLIAVRILVNLKAGFVNGEEELHDWDVESQSPCGWMGVNCNNVTFEVVAL